MGSRALRVYLILDRIEKINNIPSKTTPRNSLRDRNAASVEYDYFALSRRQRRRRRFSFIEARKGNYILVFCYHELMMVFLMCLSGMVL